MPRSDRVNNRITALKSALFSSIASYLEFVLILLTGVIVARTLGPAQFGVYAFSVWLAAWLVLICNNGLTISVVRFVAQARAKNSGTDPKYVASKFIKWNFYLGLLVLSLFVGVASVIPFKEWDNRNLWFIAATLVAVYSRTSTMMIVAAAKGFEDFLLTNRVSVVTSTTSLVMVGLCWYFGGDALAFYVVYAATGIVGLAAAHFNFRKSVGQFGSTSATPSFTERNMARHAFWTAMVMLLLLLGQKTFEMFTLKSNFPAEQVGYFALALTLSKGLIDLAITGIDKIILPIFSRMRMENPAVLPRLVSESIRYYWLLGIYAFGGGVVCAAPVISLIYGSAFQPVVVPFILCSAIAVLGLATGATNAFHIGSESNGPRLKAAAAAATVSALASFFLVPSFGVIGACLSFALATIVWLALSLFYLDRDIELSLPLRPSFAALTAAAIGAMTSWQIYDYVDGRFAFLIVGLAYSLIFAIGAVILGALKATDVDLLAKLFPEESRLRAFLMRVSTRFAKH